MNDVAYTRVQTEKERKLLARSAKHKRNGSRSKKCTLPSDYLTPAQKKGLNGMVQTFEMNKPHTLKELKLWPEDLRHKYMKSILDTYNPPNKWLSEMLGTAEGSMPSVQARYFDIHPGKGRRHPNQSHDAFIQWHRFISGADDPEPPALLSTAEEAKPVYGAWPHDPMGPPMKTEDPSPETISKPSTIHAPITYDTISVQFTGTGDDLIRVIQTGPIHLSGPNTYTFNISAVRREDD